MRFLKGETKEIGIKVASNKNQPFTIRNAVFALYKVGSDIPESEGIAMVAGKEIYAVVTPQEIATYNLILTYEIALETLKAEIKIEVR